MSEAGGLHELLVLQDLDLRLDQLRHRRDHLPERAALTELAGQLRELQEAVAASRAEHHEVARRQQRLEDAVATVESRLAMETGRLYGGGLGHRELQALQHEIESLQRRKSDLEDEVLLAMEEAEPLAEAIAVMDADVVRIRGEGQQLQQRLVAAQAEIEAEIAAVTAEQTAQRALVPAGVLADYDRRRVRGGVVVGRLDGWACSACSLTLPAMDVERIRRAPDDQLETCPECGALLVR